MSTPPTELPAASPWRRLHAALMPDYNLKAAVYWWVVVSFGTLAFGHALASLLRSDPATAIQIVDRKSVV